MTLERSFDPDDVFIPENKSEQQLAEIWSTLLQSPIEKRMHFFEAGGNSLLAISLLVRTNAALNIKVTPQDLLEYPRFDEFLKRVQGLLQSR